MGSRIEHGTGAPYRKTSYSFSSFHVRYPDPHFNTGLQTSRCLSDSKPQDPHHVITRKLIYRRETHGGNRGVIHPYFTGLSGSLPTFTHRCLTQERRTSPPSTLAPPTVGQQVRRGRTTLGYRSDAVHGQEAAVGRGQQRPEECRRVRVPGPPVADDRPVHLAVAGLGLGTSVLDEGVGPH